MRIALAPLALLATLAACSNPPQYSAAPPAVSYPVTGHDVGQAGVAAERYCQQYGSSARFQGIQTTSTGNVAVYSCSGTR